MFHRKWTTQMKITSDSLWMWGSEKWGSFVLWKLLLLRAATNIYDPVNLGEMPVRSSQALHVLSLLVEGTSDAYCRDKSCLSPGAGWTKQIRLLPVTELFSQHHTIRVEVWTVQHEVFNGFRDADAKTGSTDLEHGSGGWGGERDSLVWPRQRRLRVASSLRDVFVMQVLMGAFFTLYLHLSAIYRLRMIHF